MALHDVLGFLKEDWGMALVTVLMVAGVVYVALMQVQVPDEPRPQLPVIPQSSPIEPLSRMEPLQPSPEAAPPVVVPVRPAQIGLPTRDEAKGLALQILHSLPESSGLPSSVRVGFVFYAVNPDGSITDIPESNLSFTVEPDGRLRMGIAAGINVKVRMPASRLQDLAEDFCQGLKDMVLSNEASLDMDLSALDRMALVAAALPARNRCGIP